MRKRTQGLAGGPPGPSGKTRSEYGFAPRTPTISLHGRVGPSQAGRSGLLGKEGRARTFVLGTRSGKHRRLRNGSRYADSLNPVGGLLLEHRTLRYTEGRAYLGTAYQAHSTFEVGAFMA